MQEYTDDMEFCGVLLYDTVCPRSSDPFYIESYYIKWVTTSWTHSNLGPYNSTAESLGSCSQEQESDQENCKDKWKNYIKIQITGPKFRFFTLTKEILKEFFFITFLKIHFWDPDGPPYRV